MRPRPAPADRLLAIVAALGAAGHAVALLTWSSFMPSRAPVHFDLAGRPDRWEDGRELLAVPFFALGLWAVTTLLSRFPHTFNYPVEITPANAERQYRLGGRLLGLVNASVTWFLLALLAGSAAVGRGAVAGLTPWYVAAFLFTLVAIMVWYFRAVSRG